MKWSYGVTAVPERVQNGLLEKTLQSLFEAGFDKPRLFIDGPLEVVPSWMSLYERTVHVPKVRTFGNWVLTAWELYLRDPHADRYVIFQDDFVTYRNLRQYLERCEYPEQGYWNLYTFSQNIKPLNGWYESNQLGKGAVALVFNNKAIRTLLAQQYMVDRPLNPNRGWKAVDGGIVSAYKLIGWKEYVHNPSLVQHTGLESSMGNRRHELAKTFKGEDFDALELLSGKTTAKALKDPNTYRIGLAGYNCEGWLGDRNLELVENTDICAWLVKPNGCTPTREPHPDVDTFFCPRGSHEKLKQFLDSVEVVVVCESPVYSELLPLAKSSHKRIVAVVSTPQVDAWADSVDLFICTTLDAYNELRHRYPCVEFSWPSKWNTGADSEFNLLARTGEHRVAVV